MIKTVIDKRDFKELDDFLLKNNLWSIAHICNKFANFEDEIISALKLQELVQQRINPKGHYDHEHREHCLECKLQRVLQSLIEESEK